MIKSARTRIAQKTRPEQKKRSKLTNIPLNTRGTEALPSGTYDLFRGARGSRGLRLRPSSPCVPPINGKVEG